MIRLIEKNNNVTHKILILIIPNVISSDIYCNTLKTIYDNNDCCEDPINGKVSSECSNLYISNINVENIDVTKDINLSGELKINGITLIEFIRMYSTPPPPSPPPPSPPPPSPPPLAPPELVCDLFSTLFAARRTAMGVDITNRYNQKANTEYHFNSLLGYYQGYGPEHPNS